MISKELKNKTIVIYSVGTLLILLLSSVIVSCTSTVGHYYAKNNPNESFILRSDSTYSYSSELEESFGVWSKSGNAILLTSFYSPSMLFFDHSENQSIDEFSRFSFSDLSGNKAMGAQIILDNGIEIRDYSLFRDSIRTDSLRSHQAQLIYNGYNFGLFEFGLKNSNYVIHLPIHHHVLMKKFKIFDQYQLTYKKNRITFSNKKYSKVKLKENKEF